MKTIIKAHTQTAIPSARRVGSLAAAACAAVWLVAGAVPDAQARNGNVLPPTAQPLSWTIDDMAAAIANFSASGNDPAYYPERPLISPTEVTQREWTEVMGNNPSAYKGDERPVENVSWWEAIRYANLRSVREGLDPCYDLTTGECDLTKNGYRLPTDAEWAHAAALPEKFPDDIGKFANLGNAWTQ